MIRVSTPALFAVLFATVLAFAAQGVASGSRRTLPLLLAQTSPSATTSAGAEATTSLRGNEQAFLQDATATGHAAAELARLAVSQAATASVRDLAQQLVSDYAQMNNSLEVLARRKALALPPSPTGLPSDIRQVSGRTGTDFDRAFIRVAAENSQRELRLFETAVANAKDADVRDLAGSLLPVLRDHVNKLTDLQKGL